MDDFEQRELGIYLQRIESMATERNNLQQALKTASNERIALARTLENAETELLETFNNIPVEPSEPLEAQADLDKVASESREENYWLDELANQYLGLLEALGSQDRAQANWHLDALESLFEEERISSIPGYDARNEADREIVRFMRAYVSARDEAGLEELVAESRLLIEQAEENYRAGRYQEASIGWERVGGLWPLVESAMEGSRATRETTVARDIRRYAGLAELSLSTGDRESAALVWEAGLEEIPDPMGNELSSWWRRWIDAGDQRERVLLAEMSAISMEYEDQLAEEQSERRDLTVELAALRGVNADQVRKLRVAETERQRLTAALEEAELAFAEVIETEPAEETPEPEVVVEIQYVDNPETVGLLTDATKRITELELQLALLEGELAGLQAAANAEDSREAASRWRLYGIVVQILGDTLVIEPIATDQPTAGEELRVMRSLGSDRVIHLADGIILEVSPTRTVGTISSGTSGAEVYGSPEVNDLVYTTQY